ncbi:MAG: sialidase family protein [Planctomycetota bacterium]|nr:sialidase family protein [Planctomycetota bacterium]
MSASPFRITREPHIMAPVGDAVYAGALYVGQPNGPRRAEMIEFVRHEAMKFVANGEYQCFSSRLYRRRSSDHGKTWAEDPADQVREVGGAAGERQYPLACLLHPTQDLLIQFFSLNQVDADEPLMGIGNLTQRTYRTYYRLSRDRGRTWGPRLQVVDERPGHDAERWAPGVRLGHTGATAQGQYVSLPDGTMIVPFDLCHPKAPPQNKTERDKEAYATTRYAQARLTPDGQALTWRFGEEIAVEFPLAGGGCCEAATVMAGGSRVYCTLRCQGDEASGLHATRWSTVSEDGGMTWGKIRPLAYEDGSTVHTPASVHRFIQSSRTGKTYLLANILPAPVFAQTPRYPLTIAEFDTDRLCVKRDSVRVIQDRPAGAPVERRYTNFGCHEDRETGELVLTMPEQPKSFDFSAMKRPEEYTSDCHRWRVTPV